MFRAVLLALVLFVAAAPTVAPAEGGEAAPRSGLDEQATPVPMRGQALDVEAPSEEVRAALEETRAALADARTAQVVFDPDERALVRDTTVPPYRSVVQLTVYGDSLGLTGGYCTGTLIGPRLILTAAHCIYDKSWPTGGFAYAIRAVPGRAGSYAPFGYDWAAESWVPSGWITYSTGGDTSPPEATFYDFGLLILPSPALGNAAGWRAVARVPDSTLRRPDLLIGMAAYDGDKPFGTQWERLRASLAVFDEFYVGYQLSAYQGSSGAALLRVRDAVVLGVHAYGSPSVGINFGRRVEARMLAFFDGVCAGGRCSYALAVESEPTPTPLPTATPTPTRTATPTASPTPRPAQPTASPAQPIATPLPPTATPVPPTVTPRPRPGRVFIPLELRNTRA